MEREECSNLCGTGRWKQGYLLQAKEVKWTAPTSTLEAEKDFRLICFQCLLKEEVDNIERYKS